MTINRANVRQLLQNFEFRTLFIEEMGWSNVATRPTTMTVEGVQYMRRPIAQMSGVMVFELAPTDPKNGQIPDTKTRKAIYKQIQPLAHENLLIFLDKDESRTQSLWYWVKREGKKEQPREHLYLKGQPGDLFLSKLDGMVIELDELRADGSIPITEVTARLASSLDVERVTKRFYNDFSNLRIDFVNLIQGIEREADRQWYASVLLHRLMFIYFLQEKGFIQNTGNYLNDKLAESKHRGPDRYFAEFLQALFFEGFAKPEGQRSATAQALLGPIKYLNGGLFLKHKLENAYPQISVPDRAFENLLALFGRYSWHLDDTPGAQDDEINPDVLGYIFEKYINQKAFGAYYTRTEITQYLCERTIHAVILDKLHALSTYRFESLGDALLKLDADLCRKLLDILKQLSVLDPACGSGAFLVAAMKILLNIYAAVYGRMKILTDTNLQAELRTIEREHQSLNYYIRKQIITQNLYAVDIMEEAAEIAKLRLFLVLVASAQTVEQLEPLPNIDFNIMAGNSLIGLLQVDEQRFDHRQPRPPTELGQARQNTLFQTHHQTSWLQALNAKRYRQLLEEKNRLIANYRYASGLTDDLQALKKQIEEHKQEAYATLNAILLDDIQSLKILYEQAQPSGKPKKRPLKIDDITTLQPFHWGYEFDEVMETRGGFDVIITNPPWEIFKPIAKEFFQEYDPGMERRGTSIKDFEKKLEELLKYPEIQQKYLDYQSRFPHISAFYRSTPQYKNQISIVNERKSGTDINLYKLFVEQSFNLLRFGGQCGIVIPSGIYSDLGTKQLREMLFDQSTITSLFCFENRKEIFEGVHRSFKFVVLTFEKGGNTKRFPAAFMRLDVSELEHFPTNDSMQINIDLIRRLAPDSLSVTEFNEEIDVRIAEKMLQFPLLGENLPNRWRLQLIREFDMTNDSSLFRTQKKPGMLPLYEGKMVWHFIPHYSEERYWIDEKEGRKNLVGKRANDAGIQLDYQYYRFGCRSITGNTNERTMVCCIIPRNVFCGNSLQVSRRSNNQINNAELLYLNALMSSFVIDFSLRQRVATQMNMFYVYQTPIPRLTQGDHFFDAIVERAARLICTTPEFDDLAKEVGLSNHKQGVTEPFERARLRAELDGMIAHLYELTEVEFAHILNNFPLVPEPVKVAARNSWRDVDRGILP